MGAADQLIDGVNGFGPTVDVSLTVEVLGLLLNGNPTAKVPEVVDRLPR
jgi:hypothetical protein